MKVILRQSIEKLGKPGDVVNVKPGYGNNFLIPQGMAVICTPGNVKVVKQEKRRISIKEAKFKNDAELLAQQFQDTVLTYEKRCSPEGVLYGSVTAPEITESLAEKGLEIDKRNLVLSEPIKRVGTFTARIRLHAEIELVVDIIVKGEGYIAGIKGPDVDSPKVEDSPESETPELSREEPMKEEAGSEDEAAEADNKGETSEDN